MKCSKCSNLAKAKGLCGYHYQQEWRKQNLMKYAYNNLKSNAKSRGKDFDLTFEEFSKFAIETDYIGKKGKTSTSYSIDRIKNELGYTLSNIRVLPLGENSRKGVKTLNAYYDFENNEMYARVMTIHQTVTTSSDCPF